MAWDDVIAAVGGAAAGLDSGIKFQRTMNARDEALQVREMLAALREAGLMQRAQLSDTTRNRQITVNDENADATRAQNARDTAGRLEHLWDSNRIREESLYVNDATRQRGQNMQDDRFWGGTMPLGWAADATRNAIADQQAETTRRGQDIGAATARRGQDIGAETSRSNADLSAEVTQRGQDITSATQQRAQDVRAASPWGNLFAPDGATTPATQPAPPPAAVAPPAKVTRPGGGTTPTAPTGKPTTSTASKSVTMAQLRAIAARRGTTVDVQKARAKSEGFTVVEETGSGRR